MFFIFFFLYFESIIYIIYEFDLIWCYRCYYIKLNICVFKNIILSMKIYILSSEFLYFLFFGYMYYFWSVCILIILV